MGQIDASYLLNGQIGAQEEVELAGAKEELEQELNQVQQLVQRINSVASTHKVTAQVKGVLKSLHKSYGGSIVPREKLNKKSLEQLEVFFANFKVPKKEQEEFQVFVAFNEQIPHMLIRSKNPLSLLKTRFIARVKSWHAASPLPFGQFVKILGKEGDSRTESAVILHEYNVDTKPFSAKVMKCLPAAGAKWSIPPQEAAKRVDLRAIPVCSVDPPGCKDIDDALHCRVLPNGNIEVGVHIADVTHFVQSGSELDREAARRCTTVYLVGQRTDMVPKLLTENLCSLVSDVDRLAFSVIWEFDPKTFKAKSLKFHKSII
jgi:exosome complex exonuclease DIS3/RRP44